MLFLLSANLFANEFLIFFAELIHGQLDHVTVFSFKVNLAPFKLDEPRDGFVFATRVDELP